MRGAHLPAGADFPKGRAKTGELLNSVKQQREDMAMQHISYVNGAFVPYREASVSIRDRGFLFGDGIYEVTAVIGGKMVDNGLHLERLRRSLKEVRIAEPEVLPHLPQIQHRLIDTNKLQEGIVYIQITRGAAERDFVFPPADVPPSVVLFTQEKNLVGAPSGRNGLKVKTLPDIRWARRDIKSVNLLAQVLAKQAAADAGCQEAWMLDGDMVTEGGSSTAYIVTHDNIVITRPRSTATLAGCTCVALQRLLEKEGLRSEERPFSLAEALAAKEVFATSATTLVTAVVEIDGVPIGNGRPGPIVTELRRVYLAVAAAS